jgi:hypothetical protein
MECVDFTDLSGTFIYFGMPGDAGNTASAFPYFLITYLHIFKYQPVWLDFICAVLTFVWLTYQYHHINQIIKC